VAVEPDPAFPGGHALLRIHGAGKFSDRPAVFSIKRDDYDEAVFGPRGWQVAGALLSPDSQSVEGDDLLLHIGPSVVQHIVSGVYRIAVPAAGVETNVFWPDLPLMADEALNMVAEPVQAQPKMAPPPPRKIQRPGPDRGTAGPRPDPAPGFMGTGPASDDTVKIENKPPVPPPPTVEETDPVRRNWLKLAVSLAVVLVIAGGGGYFAYRWLFPPPPPPVAEDAPKPPPSDNPQPQPLDLSHMTAAEALRSGAPPEALLAEAERRMQLDGAQRSEALLLMQGAAARNYLPAHAALGRLYDPDIQHPPEIQADARQAASHYKIAANGGDTSVAEPRAALQAYLQRQASRGDMFAPLILKEFWP
jgi:hypothetical protein